MLASNWEPALIALVFIGGFAAILCGIGVFARWMSGPYGRER